MTDTDTEALREMLSAAGVPLKPSYTRPEVCRILGISTRTFWYLVDAHGPESLDSYLLRRHRRVPITALAAFLARNRAEERLYADHGA
jgi:hypothetical protein